MTTLIDPEVRAAGAPTGRAPSGWAFPPEPSAHAGPTTTPCPSGSAAPVREVTGARGSDRYVAPARFDVHQIESFERWAAAAIGSGASRLVVDCSSVEFIDLAALESIERLRAQHLLEPVDRSVAYLITSRLVGADDAELAAAA